MTKSFLEWVTFYNLPCEKREEIFMKINIFEVVKHIAPNARDNYLQATRKGDLLFEKHEITTPLRLAHFLAQALHETDGFTVLRENMNYSESRLIECTASGFLDTSFY